MPDLKCVEDLLLEWESGWRAGCPVTPEQLCPDWPEGQAELRRRVELLCKFEAFSAGAMPTANYANDQSPAPAVPGCTIRGKLGEGGMGVVYRAWQEDLGREVAVKVMKGGPDMPASVVRRFAQEARLLARLQHDNLVPIYEAKLHLGQPYFVMELIQGGNLAQAVERYAADPASAAALVEVVARVVHYAHEQGVLHRDLKPANILLDKQGRPRVSDFGLAKLFGEGPEETVQGRQGVGATGTTTLSALGGPMGTPPYMAPEQYQAGSAPVTPRTDVWSLGVILYELLTGKRPFEATDLQSYAKLVCASEPAPPRCVQPKIDEDLQEIVLTCLQKEPGRRYATAAEVAEDLAAWRRRGFPKVSKASKVRRLVRWLRRRPAVVGAMVLTTVLAVAVVAMSMHPQPSPSVPVDPDLPLKEIEARLAQGEKEVELIAKTGAPAWYRTVIGGNHTHPTLSADGAFSVDSWEDELSLVELVHDPQKKEYTISAQVRYDKGNPRAEVGIYCCRYQYASTETEAHTFIYLGYNDGEDDAAAFQRLPEKVRAGRKPTTGNMVLFPFHWFGKRQGNLIADDHIVDPSQANVFKAAGPNVKRWRTLILKVTPDNIEAYWEKTTPVAKIATQGLAAEADEALRAKGVGERNAPGLQEIYPSFPQRGGLGVYVRHCTASFCCVSIDH